MALKKLRDYFNLTKIKYIVVSHSLAYGAQGIAALTHISGQQIAKTISVNTSSQLPKAFQAQYRFSTL